MENNFDIESVRQIRATIIAAAFAQSIEACTPRKLEEIERNFFASYDYAYGTVCIEHAHLLDQGTKFLMK